MPIQWKKLLKGSKGLASLEAKAAFDKPITPSEAPQTMTETLRFAESVFADRETPHSVSEDFPRLSSTAQSGSFSVDQATLRVGDIDGLIFEGLNAHSETHIEILRGAQGELYERRGRTQGVGFFRTVMGPSIKIQQFMARLGNAATPGAIIISIQDQVEIELGGCIIAETRIAVEAGEFTILSEVQFMYCSLHTRRPNDGFIDRLVDPAPAHILTGERGWPAGGIAGAEGVAGDAGDAGG